jgi:hypothetical protein
MISVGSEAWADTLATLRSCGDGRRECVMYWVGPVANPGRITGAVHPVHTASAGHYEVDGAWLTAFWLQLAKTQDQVRVQVHTHGGLASHSDRDNKNALVYKPGFLSLVLPGFAMSEDCRERAFLAEVLADGGWDHVAVGNRLKWL